MTYHLIEEPNGDLSIRHKSTLSEEQIEAIDSCVHWQNQWPDEIEYIFKLIEEQVVLPCDVQFHVYKGDEELMISLYWKITDDAIYLQYYESLDVIKPLTLYRHKNKA